MVKKFIVSSVNSSAYVSMLCMYFYIQMRQETDALGYKFMLAASFET